jgi:hypothetical protein
MSAHHQTVFGPPFMTSIGPATASHEPSIAVPVAPLNYEPSAQSRGEYPNLGKGLRNPRSLGGVLNRVRAPQKSRVPGTIKAVDNLGGSLEMPLCYLLGGFASAAPNMPPITHAAVSQLSSDLQNYSTANSGPASWHSHVAFMSRGVAGTLREPLENKGNRVQHARHETDRVGCGLLSFSCWFSVPSLGSGGGTRTPDLRIMIPLL